MEAAAKQKKQVKQIANTRGLFTTKNMVLMAMLGALSGLLMYIQVPVPFAPSFYKLDFCDVPVLIGSFALGPAAGFGEHRRRVSGSVQTGCRHVPWPFLPH